MVWRTGARRTIWFLLFAFVFSIGAGYLAALSAQDAAKQTTQTQIAVAQTNIVTLQAQQAQLVTRMDVMDQKLASISDRLSNMQGIGTGAICLLTLINLAGIGFNFYARKP